MDAKLVHSFYWKKDNPVSIAWSPDGSRIVVGDSNGRIEVLTVEGHTVWKMKKHKRFVHQVIWSSNGLKIASASWDGTIIFYDSSTGEILLKMKKISRLFKPSVTWSPDSKSYASNLVIFHNSFPFYGSLGIFNAFTGQLLKDLNEKNFNIGPLSWSPNGKWLASAGKRNEIGIFETSTGYLKISFIGHKNNIHAVMWSPDSRLLATASKDKTARVWEIDSGKCLFIFEGHTGEVYSVSWSSDGKILASGSSDKTVRLWDTISGYQLFQMDATGAVLSLSFAPDRNHLISVFGDAILQIWDVSDFTQDKKTISVNNSLEKYIAMQAATIGIHPPAPAKKAPWVPHFPEAEGDCLGVLRGESDHFPALAMFPDGQTTATGHRDGKFRCWDLKKGRQIWE
jgi:WD40 repeat protein